MLRKLVLSFALLVLALAPTSFAQEKASSNPAVQEFGFDFFVDTNKSGPQTFSGDLITPLAEQVGKFESTCTPKLEGTTSKLICNWKATLSDDKFVNLDLNVQFQKHNYFTVWDTISTTNRMIFPSESIKNLYGQEEAVIVAKGYYRAHFSGVAIAARRGTLTMPLELSNTSEF